MLVTCEGSSGMMDDENANLLMSSIDADWVGACESF